MDPVLVVTSGTGVMFLMNFIANFKAMNPNNHPTEDSKLGVNDEAKAAFAKRLEKQGGVDRWTQVAQNNHENLGLALGVLLAAFSTDTSSEFRTKIMYCFLTYVGARVLFTFCYLFSLSPWRSLAFLVGQVSVLVAAGFAFAQIGGVIDLPLIVMGFTTVLYLMNFVARAKSSNPNNHPPEDKVLGAKFDKEKQQGYQKMEEGPSRWHRIAENQGEQFPIAVLILMCTVYVRYDANSAYCMLCYLAFRVLFLVCYLLAVQPFRSIFFLLGNVSVITSAVLSIMSAKDQDNTTALTATVCNLVMFVMYNLALLKAMNPNEHLAEDSKIGMDEDAKQKFATRVAEQGGVDRWTRIATNQKENFPLALYVLWAAVVSGVGINAAYCFGAYLTLRVLFLICYLFALSPWRSVAFLLSTITVFTAAGFGISAAFSAAAP